MTDHSYNTLVSWHGSTGGGYRNYSRSHQAVAQPATTAVALSADPHFRGDADLLNPEQLLVMATSSCQLLSFLAVAAANHIDVIDYQDDAHGFMPEDALPMRITRIELSISVTVAPNTDHDTVRELINEAHEKCFIARSLTSEVSIIATVVDA